MYMKQTISKEKWAALRQELGDRIEEQGSLDGHRWAQTKQLAAPEEKRLIRSLLAEGKAVRLRSGKLASLKKAGYVRGPIEIKRDGFGFIRDPEGDVFIPAKQMHGAMQGEEVLAWAGKVSRKGREGRIERVLSPLPYRAVASYALDKKGRPYAMLENAPETGRKVALPKEAKRMAKKGDVVVLAITRRAGDGKLAEGRIEEVLGKASAPGVDILSIARGYGLYAEFPEKVMREAEKIPETVGDKELAHRELLFDKQIFTIDGVDSKDLDDAISLERGRRGHYLLGVHIADVSYYVHAGSALDREAFSRGTSVYLVDQVIPMLPKRLSNGICSLNEGVTRLTMSCFMEIDAEGELRTVRFANTAIRSCHRLNYDEVNQLLENKDADAEKKYADIAPILRRMEKLAAILREKRHRDGNIDFDVPEAKILLDDRKKPIEIQKRVQRTAEKLIEEFMICCNNAVAKSFAKAESPFLYRIHDRPDPVKLEFLGQFLSNFGYREDTLTNKELQKILEDCTGSPQEHMIKTIALRSMKKAVYSPDNHGHFGLGSEAYTHFTSPIRRYPDLVVHRLLKARLAKWERSEHTLAEIAVQANQTERRAIEAERKVEDIKKAEYMSEHIGEVFTGRVSGVVASGVFVELENTVEGFVPAADLHGGPFQYVEAGGYMQSQKGKRRICLGDVMQIRVVSADKATSRIDFSEISIPKKRKA